MARRHSEYLTGDALGSLRCDCGDQLDAALRSRRGRRWCGRLPARTAGRASRC
ncbi:hypothetical protein ACW2Q0_05850 [Nocardia sp. R16R-3T]